MYFLLAMTGLATLGYLLFTYSAEEIIQSSEQQVVHACELVDIKFNAFLQNVQRDITYLSHSPHLNDYLHSIGGGSESLKKELLSQEYLALINSKPDYAQIRLIGIEQNGKEVIRAERLNAEVFLVPENSLQEKGDRNYFYETVELPPDSIYFSPIDLNKEYGKISNPPMSTIRVASPIYVGGNIFGIVVINIDLHNFFKELKITAGPKFDLKLLNQDGHFLIHPDTSKIFTFEYGKNAFFKNDFGVSVDSVKKAFDKNNKLIFRTKDYLYAFRGIPYPRRNYTLYVGIGSGEKQMLQSFYDWRKKSMSITFGLALLIFVLAFIYMRRQAKELKGITDTMTSFPQNMTPTKLPISRKDEIGQLAKSFEEMSEIISRNLTDLKRAKEEVEQAIKEKDTFLENMSHEIRNPIHSIIGMTHLLEKNNPGRHQKAFIEALKFNSKNLLSLVNDILDFKKLNTGEIHLKNEWLSLPQLIQEIINSHKFNAVAKKITLTTNIDPVLNQYLVFFDPVRLTQIVNNLLINAIKFTGEHGTVQLNASVGERANDNISIRFSIKDNGIGIEEKRVNKIVERYYTENEMQGQGLPEGAGLGLPIVVQLLKLYDSTLQIQSKLGEGSNFYFDLTSDVKPQVNSSIHIDEFIFTDLLSDARLLAIDDDEQILLLYKHIFEKCTNSLVLISNIEDVKNLKDNSFDIIISDINFNDKSLSVFGEEIGRILNKSGFFYIVSGLKIGQVEQKELPIPKNIFEKPISPDSLLSNIAFDFAVHNFGEPNTSNILKDYDHDPFKFQKAINLLIDDWEKMLQQIEAVAANNDGEKFIALRHKLITSVRWLQLPIFEKILDSALSQKENNIQKPVMEKVKKMMSFYIWSLKRINN